MLNEDCHLPLVRYKLLMNMFLNLASKISNYLFEEGKGKKMQNKISSLQHLRCILSPGFYQNTYEPTHTAIRRV